MTKKGSIIINLQIGDTTIDLKIPTAVTIERLKELLKDALHLIQVTLPEQFHIELNDKSIELSDGAYLSDYPVGNGDQFVIVNYEDMEGK